GGTATQGMVIEDDEQGNEFINTLQIDAADFWIQSAGFLVFSGLELDRNYSLWADPDFGENLNFVNNIVAMVKLTVDKPVAVENQYVATHMPLIGPVDANTISATFVFGSSVDPDPMVMAPGQFQFAWGSALLAVTYAVTFSELRPDGLGWTVISSMRTSVAEPTWSWDVVPNAVPGDYYQFSVYALDSSGDLVGYLDAGLSPVWNFKVE
ncbi:MAG: hypothetical protein J4N80_07555, partial [Chloroflexi bacterium]|nr:hypothetical protein [Chloroflexota bacterium]